ncbi:IS4 transposase [Sulfurisphaera ohwakuensis]|uniref:IS4 transposase n=1 Tax=Sulfurisphaera ohwakuensis TaxID=69656 RepID=A0A7J9RWC4_SULOH|nr:IS4 transposase [Sulfurisphaera ohwakuensis]
MLGLLLFWLRGRWGVENAFRSLEEFRVRTCDVRKELVLVLLSYFLLNVLVGSWRRVRLWEFSQAIVDFLILKEMRGVVAQGFTSSWGVVFRELQLTLCTPF